MAVFVLDTFTDTNGTAITSHTGETGATWTAFTGSAFAPTIESNALSPSNGAILNSFYYASGTPASADYTVTTEVVYNGGTDAIAGSGGRMSTSAQTGYFGFLFGGASGVNADFAIYKYVSGTLTALASSGVSVSLTSGLTYTITLDLSGTTIALRVQRSSDSNWLNSSNAWQSGQTNALSVTDSSITSAGKAGFWLSRTAANSSTINQLSADDASGGGTTAPISVLAPKQVGAFYFTNQRGA